MLRRIAFHGFAFLCGVGLALSCARAPAQELMAEAPKGEALTTAPSVEHGGPCGEDCCRSGGFYVGAGVDFMVPHWKTNPAYAISSTVGGVTNVAQTDFDYDLDAAPFVWAGFRGASGFGAMARAWWYDDSQNISLANPGALSIDSAAPLGLQNPSNTAGDVLSFQSVLEIDVIDALGTYTLQRGNLSADLGAGVRYAHLNQEYHHSEVPLNGLVDAISSGHNFNGVGPLLSAQGRFNVSRRIALIGTLRGALLFGESQQTAFQVVNNALSNTALQENDDVLPVLDLELGGEYSVPMGRMVLFLQGAFVSQIWFGAGNSANNELIPITVDPEVSDKDADLGLYGFRVAGGVRY